MGVRYSCPLQTLVISLLLFLVSTFFFSRTRGVRLIQILRHTGPSVSIEKLVLPCHARCAFSLPCCNGHNLPFNFYLYKIGSIKNLCCSACGHPPPNPSHFILPCPATDSWRRSLFADSVSLYDLWSRLWRIARPMGFHGLLPCSHSLEEVG